MRPLLPALFLALCAGPLAAADLVLTRKVHMDAYTIGGNEVPVKDTTQVTWLGKERLRMDEGERVTIVRLDLKKVWMIDTARKTYSAVDLPVDVLKYVPEQMAPMIEQMLAAMKPVVTPTDETKKFGEWNARQYVLKIGPPANVEAKIWVTQDLGIPVGEFKDLAGAIVALKPGGQLVAEELRKAEGIPVFQERVQKIGTADVKSSDELVSAERKEPAEGWYEVPKDFEEEPFDVLAEAMRGAGAAPKPR